MQILVIIPAGSQTVHESWIEKDLTSVDFAVIWYSDSPVPDSIKQSSKYLFNLKGSKWQLIKTALTKINWHRYDYIWMPDDDLECKEGSIKLLCETMEKHDMCLAQPSLTKLNVQWQILINRPNTTYHETNFIEIQAPCFNKDCLEYLMHTISDPDVVTGWGLDFVWSTSLKKLNKRIGVIDVVKMEHTRVSKKQDSDYQGGGTRPFEELFKTLSKYNIKRYTPRILVGSG